MKICFKDGHVPALKLLTGAVAVSDSRDLRPSPVKKPWFFDSFLFFDLVLRALAGVLPYFSAAVFL